MMEKIHAESDFVYNIVFSDKVTFNGNVNQHNCIFWSDTNFHWTLEYQQKINVWAGILNNTLISSFFIT